MWLEDLVSQYGYLAIMVGTFLEGETILVLGGLAAQNEYLELTWVITMAFIGTLFGDQLYYYIGRQMGSAIIEKRPQWQARAVKMYRLLHRYPILAILSFRYLYGIRMVAPFVIGASGIHPVKYLVLNVIGALIWAVSVGYAGYLLGDALENILDDFKHYQLYVLGGIALIALAVWIIRIWRAKQRAKAAQ